MTVKILAELFQRDLLKLKEEINLYADEAKLWVIDKEIKNSAGNLALHLAGNLKHFIGVVLGDSGYVRNREAEFADKNIPRHEIIKSIDETSAIIHLVLNKMSDADLEKEYPLEVLKYKGRMTAEFFLVHLYGHLNYHLGQINYHRRLLK